MVGKISIIVPIFNEAKIVENAISELYQTLHATFPHFELILVDDGSTDQTPARLEHFKNHNEHVIVLHSSRNYGKGHALKSGSALATGDIVCFIDSDLSIPAKYVQLLTKEIEKGCDIAIASRYLSKGDSNVFIVRRIVSFCFVVVRKLLLGLNTISDTQCGCKAFKASVLQKLNTETKIDGFCYDLELLYISQKYQYSIVEVPVVLEHKNSRMSKVNILKQTFLMTRDMLLIRKYHGQK